MQEAENKTTKGIIRTLCYSDIFGYPLTKSEIYKFFYGDNLSLKDFNRILEDGVISGKISKYKKYYFLNGKVNYCKGRINKMRASEKKWKIAVRAASILSKIPTVELIGVSGSLSMNNAQQKDDIDLFIITSKGSLWFSRFLVNVALIIMGIKRGREDSYGVNQICPNMFVSEDNLLMPKNLFVAHEIAQLKILVNKDNIYERFLYENRWALRYLPNAFKVKGEGGKWKRKGKRLIRPLGGLAMALIENIFYAVQLAYMKKRITTEKIGLNKAFFHPKDKTGFAIKLYKQRYTNYIRHTKANVRFQPQINTFSMALDTPGY